MKLKLALAVLALSSISLSAQAMVDVTKMTCSQARNYIQSHGPVVVTYAYSARAGRLYTKVYPGVCPRRGDSRSFGFSVHAQTVDSPSCFIGRKCR